MTGVQTCALPISPHEHRNPVFRQVLLVAEIPINGDEHLEFPFGEPEQTAILDSSPLHLRHGPDRVPGKNTRQPAVDALVEKKFHVRPTRR